MKTIKKLLILIIPVLLFACKQPVKKEIVYIPEEMKPYIMFSVGSYWVYEDSATLQTDSFYLKEIYTDFYSDPANRNIDYETIIQYFYNENSDNKTAISSIFFDYNSSIYYKNFYGGRFRHDIPENGYIMILSDSLKHDITFDTLIISDETYNNVMVLDYHSLYRTYWCEGVGMIRHEILKKIPLQNPPQDTLIIFNLKNYNIKK